MTQNDTKKTKSHKTGDKLMLIRYGRMGMLGWFTHNESRIDKVNHRVVVKTARGLELGTLIGPYSYKSGSFRWNCKKVSEYYDEENYGKIVNRGGSFVRYATKEDLNEERHMEASTRDELKTGIRITKEMNLPMRIVDVEHIFGGERIIFYFSAEGRIDFRELVKKMAQEFQTRIEMRQIGARDETKLISDYETCGQQCCCSRYMKVLKPVNMRMAKLQKATLDPSKISGYCGRLKCCLRYEDDLYRDLKKKQPKKGVWVKTEYGEGEVVGSQVLTQLAMIRGNDGTKFAVGFDELEVIARPEKKEEVSRGNNVRRSKVPTVKKVEEKGEQNSAKESDGQEQTPKQNNQQDGNKKRRKKNRNKRNRQQNSENNSEVRSQESEVRSQNTGFPPSRE